MNPTKVTELNEQLLRKPEPLRESLARYITEHLEELENEMNWAEGSGDLSPEWKAEMDRRIDNHERNPEAGVSWEELNERLAKSR